MLHPCLSRPHWALVHILAICARAFYASLRIFATRPVFCSFDFCSCRVYIFPDFQLQLTGLVRIKEL
jgi:hypothetical protein